MAWVKEVPNDGHEFQVGPWGSHGGQPFDPHFTINNAVSNIICSITFGERFDYQDDQFQELLRLLDEILNLQTSVCCQLYNVFPRIMNFLPGPHQTLFSNLEKLKMFVAKMIENHKRDWNPAEARDFIDAYLQEIEKHKGDAASSFREENLIYNTLDLFFAGTETTSTTLRWGLLYMALNPEIQGSQQSALLSSQGTVVVTNLTALHRDPAEWATPDTFNPEHFLENGQFKKRESFLPFSIGQPFNPHFTINNAVSNIICSITFGE
ncbi:hypothetical protein Celaphus_00002486 [Cervus elaphus hippelaphus]|uniref:CYP2J2 n=1 Tax=Cervus elaphus hippelaphus TaxID=46360 RepID=A0A212CEV3_CEREH|nr:hypothetical protein Celaphus_00002486 [Cervus elaphus hippelaphus]